MYTKKQISNARAELKTAGVNSLLTGSTQNPKTAKNGKTGLLTAPLHLAPADLSGYNVCPMASAGCKASCLHTAGNPAYMRAKEKARIARTRAFFEHREAFMIALWADIAAHIRKAEKLSMFAGCRLNATSDIPWEAYHLPERRMSIIEAFPNVTMYDYTKIPKRMDSFLLGGMPSNYYLTFSATESNWDYCETVLDARGTVAVPFAVKRNAPLPETYRGHPVIDGDKHDNRPSDPKGVIVGLRAKGEAIGDETGFVHYDDQEFLNRIDALRRKVA